METTQTSGPWRAARAPQMAPNGPLQWRAENYLFLPKKRCFETNQGISLGGVFVSCLKRLCKQTSVLMDITRKDKKKIGIELNPKKAMRNSSEHSRPFCSAHPNVAACKAADSGWV